MTYRERRLAKAERLREWARKREAKAASVFKAGEHYHGDHAFNTQPGHIPERARLIAREDRAHESLTKASSMASRAAGIEAAADRAIYSDDPDAIEQLQERIATLEAERDRIKAYNVSCRKGARNVSLLDDKQAARLKSVAQVASYQLGKNGAYPSYGLSNLSGNITQQKKRLAQLIGTPDTSTRCYACHRKNPKARNCFYCGKPVILCGHCAWRPSSSICEVDCR